jgi:hypothetical protein
LGRRRSCWGGSGRSQKSLELRDVEQWYVDGSNRNIVRGESKFYVRDVGPFMTSPPHNEVKLWYVPGTRQERTINVKFAAWKRGAGLDFIMSLLTFITAA